MNSNSFNTFNFFPSSVIPSINDEKQLMEITIDYKHFPITKKQFGFELTGDCPTYVKQTALNCSPLEHGDIIVEIFDKCVIRASSSAIYKLMKKQMLKSIHKTSFSQYFSKKKSTKKYSLKLKIYRQKYSANEQYIQSTLNEIQMCSNTMSFNRTYNDLPIIKNKSKRCHSFQKRNPSKRIYEEVEPSSDILSGIDDNGYMSGDVLDYQSLKSTSTTKKTLSSVLSTSFNSSSTSSSCEENSMKKSKKSHPDNFRIKQNHLLELFDKFMQNYTQHFLHLSMRLNHFMRNESINQIKHIGQSEKIKQFLDLYTQLPVIHEQINEFIKELISIEINEQYLRENFHNEQYSLLMIIYNEQKVKIRQFCDEFDKYCSHIPKMFELLKSIYVEIPYLFQSFPNSTSITIEDFLKIPLLLFLTATEECSAPNIYI
ncbi:hypothetical protein SNEBB_007000 [Seison nebaliae]|nr:hypothetical protein SNEBB_007000 [Seison nebaliae]